MEDQDIIEAAKSGRAACRGCKKKIEKDALRFGEAFDGGFGDSASYRWFHLDCAAARHPTRLEGAIERYAGQVPDQADLEKKIEAGKKSAAKKKKVYPYAEKAPTGRSSCISCDAKIEKADLRIAIEREIDMGAFQRKGAGYLHVACAADHIDDDDLFDHLQENTTGLDDDDWDIIENAM